MKWTLVDDHFVIKEIQAVHNHTDTEGKSMSQWNVWKISLLYLKFLIQSVCWGIWFHWIKSISGSVFQKTSMMSFDRNVFNRVFERGSAWQRNQLWSAKPCLFELAVPHRLSPQLPIHLPIIILKWALSISQQAALQGTGEELKMSWSPRGEEMYAEYKLRMKLRDGRKGRKPFQ